MVFVSIPELTDLSLRARRVAELVALRLTLPSRLARKPLDALLAELSVERATAQSIALNRLDILRAERGLARVRLVSSTCLYRALARYALLCRSGADPTFVMAVDKHGVAESGHAWVELDGALFEETEDVTRYAITFRYRSGAGDGNIEPLERRTYQRPEAPPQVPSH